MQNKTQWLRDDGSFSSKPAASPDWKGEVAQNIRGPGFANPKHDAKMAAEGRPSQAGAREAFAMRPSPWNFSGGPGMGAGFGPGDPRNTDHYWEAVAKAPGEQAAAVRHNALSQEANEMFPYGPQSEERMPGAGAPAARKPSAAGLWDRSGDQESPTQDQKWIQEGRDRQTRGLSNILGGSLAPGGASPFDASFSSILQLLED